MESAISEDIAARWCSDNLNPLLDRTIEAVTKLIDEAEERGAAKWRDPLIEACIVNWCYKAEHDTNPKLALNDCISREVEWALSPQISKEAVKLIEQGFQKGISMAADIIKDFRKPDKFAHFGLFWSMLSLEKEISELKLDVKDMFKEANLGGN